MATKYSEIYNRAMFKFVDYNFIDLEHDRRDELMNVFLKSACSDFKHLCTVDITSYNDDEEEFNYDLDDEIQEILSLGVAYYWLNSKVLNSEMLRNIMIRGDFKAYSPANLLKEMSALRTELRKEFRGKMNEYSYRNGTLDTLKAGAR